MTRHRRHHITVALATCAGLAGMLTGPSSVLALPPLLPDLVADPSDTAITSLETMQAGQSPHLLLRFPGYIHNAGPGPLEISGSFPLGDWQSGQRRMTSVVQRIYDGIGELEDSLISNVPVERASAAAPPAHQHWHTMRAAAYALVDASTRTEVAQSAKDAFCLADTNRVEAPPGVPARYDPDACMGVDGGGNPLGMAASQNAVSVTMGLSPGFRDTYGAYMWTQWVDLTGAVAPGRYAIRAIVDPDNVIFEEHELNPPAYGPELALRGWLATPQTAPAAPAGAVQRITLGATRVDGGGLLPDGDALRGVPGPVQYALASPPAHGRVEIANGVATYTPDPSYSGPDSFRFTAAEAGTRLAAPPATVALTVQAPPVAPAAGGPPATVRRLISGASLRVSRGVVTARVTAGSAGVLTISLLQRGHLIKRWTVKVTAGRHVVRQLRLTPAVARRPLAVVAVLKKGGKVTARVRVTRP